MVWMNETDNPTKLTGLQPFYHTPKGVFFSVPKSVFFAYIHCQPHPV